MAKEILDQVMDDYTMADRVIIIQDITDIIPVESRNPY